MGFLLQRLRSLLAPQLYKGEYKLVIVVRNDVPMGKGKVGAQCAHAAVACYQEISSKKGYREICDNWLYLGQPKIVLRISGEENLLELARKARKAGLVAAVIRDAGRTQVEPGTVTVLGIGPAPKAIVDDLTSELKLL